MVVYKSLTPFITVIVQVLIKKNIYEERIEKVSVIALFRIINTVVYNSNTSTSGKSKVNSILVSPVKYKNFDHLV